MAGIFAIIAIIGQGVFAIIAMDFIAIIANCNNMNDLDMKNKAWLANHLAAIPHGDLGRVATAVGVTPTQLSRMANIDRAASPKNTQNIPLTRLLAFSKYFKDLPPGLVEALTSQDTGATPKLSSSVDVEIAERLQRTPHHLKDSFLAILRSWTPVEAAEESGAASPRPKKPTRK